MKSNIYLTPSLNKIKEIDDELFTIIKNLIVNKKIEGVYAGVKNVVGVTLLLNNIEFNELQHLVDLLKKNSLYKEDVIITETQHAIILDIPGVDVQKFLEGKYSQIYSENINKYVKNKRAFDVLDRTDDGFESFFTYLTKQYGDSIIRIKSDIKAGEYDIPPDLKQCVL